MEETKSNYPVGVRKEIVSLYFGSLREEERIKWRCGDCEKDVTCNVKKGVDNLFGHIMRNHQNWKPRLELHHQQLVCNFTFLYCK
jgi:hypothetical protein